MRMGKNWNGEGEREKGRLKMTYEAVLEALLFKDIIRFM